MVECTSASWLRELATVSAVSEKESAVLLAVLLIFWLKSPPEFFSSVATESATCSLKVELMVVSVSKRQYQ